MRYRRSVSWVFEQKDWPITLLCLAVASLVPMVGPIAANGYQAAVAVELGRAPGREQVRPFDLSALTVYLMTGLRLFLVGLAASVALLPLLFAGIAGLGLVTALVGATAARPEAHPGPLLAAVLVAGTLLIATVALGVASLVAPLWLRAAHLEDIAAAYDVAFCRDFWRRVGWASVACHFGMAGIAIALFALGMLCCFVGIFPAMALVFLVQAHLYAQLYRLYLERGGTPIADAPPSTIS
ncbi:MAG: hypothetical protein IPJ17_02460 [Holophagales bacterium]|nr:MAG: hypothetical protein IPJ17_02460 [Holophagales bacterium]